MPTTYAIPNGATAFAATTYTGNSTYPTTITNGGNNPLGTTFQPDLVWMKARSIAYDNILYDSIRGTGTAASLISNSIAAEGADAVNANMSAFASNGFTIGSTSSTNILNASGQTFVGWQWKAGGTAVSNTAGSITSSVSANASAGFSVATFTAPASNQSFTVGHGLGVAPKMTIVKRRDSATGGDWWTWHIGLGDNTSSYLALNQTAAVATAANAWGTVGRNSTVCGFNAPATIIANGTYVMYNWAEVAGYSKFGSYTGNGSADGTFVYLGFRPRFIMWKRTDSLASWGIHDTSRDTYNVAGKTLYPDGSYTEDSSTRLMDILSNGFKNRENNADSNASGGTYIYAAFAENPFKYANAR